MINPELIESVDDPSEYVCLDEEDDRESRPTLWITTIAGNALAKARIGRPIARAKAQELLDGVVARAREMNADPLSLHWITEVVVYGSFVSRDEVLVGDVDIAVQLESRYPRDEYMRRQREMIAVAVPSGRRGSKL